MRILLVALLVGLSINTAHGAANASDNAGDPAYASGWDAGNHGTGWATGWTLNHGDQSGFFSFTSSQNGNGSSGNIDTGGRSWGMFSNNNAGQTPDALRDFNGALNVGQTFSLDMDNGFLNQTSTVGFGLQNIAGASNRLEIYFVGNDGTKPDYRINDASGEHGTGIGFTADGLHIAVTLTGANTYSAIITPNGGSPTGPFTGTLSGTGGVDRVRLFDFNSGSGSASNMFFNSIAITPEPASLGLLGLAAVGLFRRRR